MKSEENSEDIIGMASTTLEFRPLALGQYILGLEDSQIWKVVYREAITRKTLQLVLETGKMNIMREVTYVYDCECEATNDGRLVFHDQLGLAFIVLDHAESASRA